MTYIIDTITFAFTLVFRLDVTMLGVLIVFTRLLFLVVVATIPVYRHMFVITVIVASFVSKLACTHSVTKKNETAKTERRWILIYTFTSDGVTSVLRLFSPFTVS